MTKSIVSFAIRLCGLLVLVSAVASCTANRTPNIKVQFVNSRVGWIVGPRLLKTTDGGQTWNEVRREGFGTFEGDYVGYGHRSIQFIDSATGVQLGGNLIAKTRDGGNTWTEHHSIPKAPGQDMPPQSLFFLSPDFGWVVGEYIYQTSDGGRSWTLLSMTPVGDNQRQRSMRVAPSFANYMPTIWFSDPKNGLMARLDGEVYSTDDGGKTWEMIWRVDKRITDMYFSDQQSGWLAGDDGFVASTVDGGRTWRPMQTPAKANLTSVFFVDRQNGVVASDGGTISYTEDGGATWKTATLSGVSRPSPPLASISFTDKQHGWAVGGNGDPMYPSPFSPSNVILATEDGGKSWKLFRSY